jgi:hypothetical protein
MQLWIEAKSCLLLFQKIFITEGVGCGYFTQVPTLRESDISGHSRKRQIQYPKPYMVVKLIISHITIIILTIPIMEIASSGGGLNQITHTFSFLSILLLYFVSGYISTKSKTSLLKYFTIAFIGSLFWLFCYLKSPESTNYKGIGNSGVWFFYELYILPASPLNFVNIFDSTHYSLITDLIYKFSMPFAFSLSQLIGGVTKLRRL